MSVFSQRNLRLEGTSYRETHRRPAPKVTPA
jgi:hypothetical protein